MEKEKKDNKKKVAEAKKEANPEEEAITKLNNKIDKLEKDKGK